MWQKYFWKQGCGGKLVGLYSYKMEREEYYFEIVFDGEVLEDIIVMGSGNWNEKWQVYFRELEMVGIEKMIELDKLLWSCRK